MDLSQGGMARIGAECGPLPLPDQRPSPSLGCEYSGGCEKKKTGKSFRRLGLDGGLVKYPFLTSSFFGKASRTTKDSFGHLPEPDLDGIEYRLPGDNDPFPQP